MALRQFETVPYLPILAISNSEMRALEELPDQDKAALLPLFHLKSWGVAHHLDSTMERVAKAYGDHPFIGDLCPPENPKGEPRPVHAELQQLRRPERGYANWCSFIEERDNIIPALQLADLTQLRDQIARLRALDRGLAVHLRGPALRVLRALIETISAETGGGEDTCFIVDLGQQSAGQLADQAIASALATTIRETAPNGTIALSASSFPSGFVNLEEQDIYERIHFTGVRRHIGPDRLIYSDRGSARAEKQTGGGGQPAPRVDLAGQGSWAFFRDEDETLSRAEAYETQAENAMDSLSWDPALRVWGCQMVERTAGGDRHAIKSPASSTAARINIHLHRQLFHDNPNGLYDTDEEWSD